MAEALAEAHEEDENTQPQAREVVGPGARGEARLWAEEVAADLHRTATGDSSQAAQLTRRMLEGLVISSPEAIAAGGESAGKAQQPTEAETRLLRWVATGAGAAAAKPAHEREAVAGA